MTGEEFHSAVGRVALFALQSAPTGMAVSITTGILWALWLQRNYPEWWQSFYEGSEGVLDEAIGDAAKGMAEEFRASVIEIHKEEEAKPAWSSSTVSN